MTAELVKIERKPYHPLKLDSSLASVVIHPPTVTIINVFNVTLPLALYRCLETIDCVHRMLSLLEWMIQHSATGSYHLHHRSIQSFIALQSMLIKFCRCLSKPCPAKSGSEWSHTISNLTEFCFALESMKAHFYQLESIIVHRIIELLSYSSTNSNHDRSYMERIPHIPIHSASIGWISPSIESLIAQATDLLDATPGNVTTPPRTPDTDNAPSQSSNVLPFLDAARLLGMSLISKFHIFQPVSLEVSVYMPNFSQHTSYRCQLFPSSCCTISLVESDSVDDSLLNSCLPNLRCWTIDCDSVHDAHRATHGTLTAALTCLSVQLRQYFTDLPTIASDLFPSIITTDIDTLSQLPTLRSEIVALCRSSLIAVQAALCKLSVLRLDLESLDTAFDVAGDLKAILNIVIQLSVVMNLLNVWRCVPSPSAIMRCDIAVIQNYLPRLVSLLSNLRPVIQSPEFSFPDHKSTTRLRYIHRCTVSSVTTQQPPPPRNSQDLMSLLSTFSLEAFHQRIDDSNARIFAAVLTFALRCSLCSIAQALLLK